MLWLCVLNLFWKLDAVWFGSISCTRRSGVALPAASNQGISLSFLPVSAADTLEDDRSAGWTAV